MVLKVFNKGDDEGMDLKFNKTSRHSFVKARVYAHQSIVVQQWTRYQSHTPLKWVKETRGVRKGGAGSERKLLPFPFPDLLHIGGGDC